MLKTKRRHARGEGVQVHVIYGSRPRSKLHPQKIKGHVVYKNYTNLNLEAQDNSSGTAEGINEFTLFVYMTTDRQNDKYA